MGADEDGTLQINQKEELDSDIVFLKMTVSANAICSFSYSIDGTDYKPMGSDFEARELRWVGASVGLYCFSGLDSSSGGGYVDLEWVRFEYQENNL